MIFQPNEYFSKLFRIPHELKFLMQLIDVIHSQIGWLFQRLHLQNQMMPICHNKRVVIIKWPVIGSEEEVLCYHISPTSTFSCSPLNISRLKWHSMRYRIQFGLVCEHDEHKTSFFVVAAYVWLVGQTLNGTD